MLSETVSVETKFVALLTAEIRVREEKILRGFVSSETYQAEKSFLHGLDHALALLGEARAAIRGRDNDDP